MSDSCQDHLNQEHGSAYIPDDRTSDDASGISYASAGVDIEAGDRAVELMKAAVSTSYNSHVIQAEGGFAGMVDVSALKNYRKPLLATSTDGVGTKVAIAQAMDIHDTIGQDLVAMVVDDIAVVGAKPLLMTDYIATGKVDPQRIADIVRGVATACAAVHTPLLGGETAEHPGLMADHEYDIAGAATGVVEADKQLGAQRVCPGDVLIALESSGLHSNGYSLVRAIVERAGWSFDRDVAEFGRTLGEELLEPTRLYSAMCQDMLAICGVGETCDNVDTSYVRSEEASGTTRVRISEPHGLHALAHITGGGLGANISRVMPRGLSARIERGSWQLPPVFSLMQQLGNVEWDDLEQTLNLGVGMVAICAANCVDDVIATANDYGCGAWILGEVVKEGDVVDHSARVISGAKGVDAGSCSLVGTYRS